MTYPSTHKGSAQEHTGSHAHHRTDDARVFSAPREGAPKPPRPLGGAAGLQQLHGSCPSPRPVGAQSPLCQQGTHPPLCRIATVVLPIPLPLLIRPLRDRCSGVHYLWRLVPCSPAKRYILLAYCLRAVICTFVAVHCIQKDHPCNLLPK